MQRNDLLQYSSGWGAGKQVRKDLSAHAKQIDPLALLLNQRTNEFVLLAQVFSLMSARLGLVTKWGR